MDAAVVVVKFLLNLHLAHIQHFVGVDYVQSVAVANPTVRFGLLRLTCTICLFLGIEIVTGDIGTAILLKILEGSFERFGLAR